jgi:uncharacterized protein (TIGR02217 family)
MSVGYIDKRLSLSVSSGFTGGPEFKTNIQTLNSGREIRNKDWKYPKHHYTANIAALNAAQLTELRSLFYACAGQWGAFRFRDAVDFEATLELLAVDAGTKNPVQLVKTYAFGTQSAVRLIQAPVSGSVTVYDSDESTPIAGSLDSTTGIFTPTSNWPHSTACWSGYFDVWVRFTSDWNAFSATRTTLGSADVELLEVQL